MGLTCDYRHKRPPSCGDNANGGHPLSTAADPRWLQSHDWGTPHNGVTAASKDEE